MPEDKAGRRIALIVASMRMGGVERMTLNLCEDFARRGWNVDLLLIAATGPLLTKVPPSVRLIDLGARRARGAVLSLRRYMVRERPAAILSAAWEANLVTLVASLGLRHKPRIVLSVRNTLSAAAASAAGVTGMMLKLLTTMLYPRADHIVAVSKGAAEDLRRTARLHSRHVGTIYNPVLRPDFDELLAQPAELFAGRDRSLARIVTVGRLATQKGHETLIRAFAKVRKERPAELVLIGEGPLRMKLEALAVELGIEDRVFFTGLLPNPYPYIREADLFVFSSLWEGFGNALVEAMATGTPVVASDCPHGPREILEDGEWGALVPPGDSAALAEAILEVLANGGIDARERARQFTVRRAADQYLTLLTGGVPAGGQARSS